LFGWRGIEGKENEELSIPPLQSVDLIFHSVLSLLLNGPLK